MRIFNLSLLPPKFQCTQNVNRSPSCLQASQPDELTIEEQEILEVIDDGDMEDWVKVRITWHSGVSDNMIIQMRPERL